MNQKTEKRKSNILNAIIIGTALGMIPLSLALAYSGQRAIRDPLPGLKWICRNPGQFFWMIKQEARSSLGLETDYDHAVSQINKGFHAD